MPVAEARLPQLPVRDELGNLGRKLRDTKAGSTVPEQSGGGAGHPALGSSQFR